jgi:catechol 2,3-dioxygenase-like lactoylglutathione lyase family enzyme
MPTKFTQFRVARPTDKLDQLIDFYRDGLGLTELGSFHDHDGFSGIMLGPEGETYHLEFTSHIAGSPCPAPTKDNLLVFYFANAAQRNLVARRLLDKGYREVAPENPYWKTHGITFEDPDQWRVVLMGVREFQSA